MIICYILALMFSVTNIVLCVTNKKIVWWECLLSVAASFLIVGGIHGMVVIGMVTDEETWSGRITHVVFYPKWIEEYQEMHTRTVGSGKNARTETYYTTEHRTHNEHWTACVSYGTKNPEYNISNGEYNRLKECFGNRVDISKPYKSGFDGGDPNVYTVTNRTNYIQPAIMSVYFENRIKAAPSVFSFTKVPENSGVYEYPKVSSWKTSNRVLGEAKSKIGILQWDQMNARLGPTKKVNVIIVGFNSKDSNLGHLQEAKWIGGKKNDLVLCYGDGWSYVFGWTEKEIVKRNLETILLKNKIDLKILPLIEEEIIKNYTIKNWEKFSYISVEPPMWSYYVIIGFLIATQVGLYFYNTMNNIDKGGNKRRYRYV